MKRCIVHVVSFAGKTDLGRLFSGLEQLSPIQFVDRGETNEEADAVLLLDFAPDEPLPEYCRGLPCFIAPSKDSRRQARRTRVEFGTADAVPPPFRAMKLHESNPAGPSVELAEQPGYAAVARIAGEPVWLSRSQPGGNGSVDVSSIPLPRVQSGETLGRYLSRERFMGVLPLLDFCRRISPADHWSPTSQRACFIFDDANLSGVTYGCIDFRAMDASTRAHGYHAAVALIPCDARKVDLEAAALFRDHRDRFSILIHGNDHVKLELARERSRDDRIRMLAEARRRMLGLPERHGLAVCMVEEPPYGVFHMGYVASLLELGYEAVLCTAPQFLSCNPEFEGSPSFGAGSAECLGAGLAVIPRIPISGGWETDAVLAAYLGKPLVIAGHHHDADYDLRFVERVVDFVNGLGEFEWCDPSQIASTRYLWRRDGPTLRVRAFGRLLTIAVPEWAESMVVERAWMGADTQEAMQWGEHGAELRADTCGRVSPVLPVAGHRRIDVCSPFAGAIDPMSVPYPRSSPWPAIRRALAETRDRCYPHLPRFLRRHSDYFAVRD